jgi:predicted DNA-binding transcriptional regulator AlpA
LNLNGKVIDLAPYLARPHLADGLNREELAALLEELKGLEGRVMARLLLGTTAGDNDHQEKGDGDCLVAAKEAAARLAVTADYLYRHADKLPFTVRLGPGQLRFSSSGIARYIQQRHGRHKA